MAKPPKMTPEEYEERLRRSREFRELLEETTEHGRRLKAEREALERERNDQSSSS